MHSNIQIDATGPVVQLEGPTQTQMETRNYFVVVLLLLGVTLLLHACLLSLPARFLLLPVGMLLPPACILLLPVGMLQGLLTTFLDN